MTNQKNLLKRKALILLVIIPAILFTAFSAVPVKSIASEDGASLFLPTAPPTDPGPANPITEKESLSFPIQQENLATEAPQSVPGLLPTDQAGVQPSNDGSNVVEVLPNLTPYTPGGWEYPVVPSTATGTYTVSTLYSTQNTYIDWAEINTGASTTNAFNSCLYLDEAELQCWYSNGLNQYYYAYVTDWLLNPPPRSGWHTLKLVVDANNDIAESDEGDNIWQQSFYWIGPTQPNLVPFAPDGWDNPIVPSTWTDTTWLSPLYTALDTYTDWALLNRGAVTSATFTSCLYYDNIQIQCWDTGDGLGENEYALVEDWLMRWLIAYQPTAGTHTLRIVGDVYNNIAESNEGDNAWQGSFTWLDSCPASSHGPAMVMETEGPSPLINDALPLPKRVLQNRLSDSLGSDPGSNLPGRYEDAVYMTGKIAVGIILPESTGNGENWTEAEKNCVVQKIQNGLGWWKTKGGSAADLNFVYETHLGVPTSYEPIDQSTADEGLWIDEVMDHLGYAGSDYFEKVYSYTDYLKEQYQTDWAYVFFVADSSNDPDGKFTNGYFGYAYLGGPLVIMTYDNDGWGINDMNWVATHETGHIFRAGDQYYQAGYGGCTSTTQRYGYLGIANSNCEYNNPNSVPSIMRSNEDVLENSAKGQIGWQDSDGNGRLDPIDTLPEFNLPQYSPDPTTQANLSYLGYVYDKPWPYAVCGDYDACFYKDITIHRISSAQYHVDGGAWSNVTFVDGAADSDFEQISFTTGTLGDGLHTVEVIAYNSIGRSTTWSDQVTVRTTKNLTVTKAGTGSGTVTSSPAGINCGTACSYAFDSNSVVTLTASPISPSIFAGWSGEGCSGTGTCTITMSATRNVTATFSAPGNQTLTVTKGGTGSGTVTSIPAGINCGSDCSEAYPYDAVVTLSTSPASGSAFAGWSGAGCSGTGTCTVTMNTARSVTATFNLNTYILTVNKGGTGSGTLTSTPTGISCGSDCSEAYGYNTVVTLTASPAAGSTFTGWSGGGCSGTGSCSVTMTATTSVTATFTLSTFSLNIGKNGTGSGTVTSNPAGINCGSDCSEIYAYNTVVDLVAIPAAGSTFTGWSGACSGNGSCEISMTSAQSVTANFTMNSYVLTVTKNGTGSGTVSSTPTGISCGTDCSESYSYNTSVTLTASPTSPSTFGGWSGGGCSGTGTCSVTMSSAQSVTATFNAPGNQSLTVSKNGTGSGTITSSPAGINCGSVCSYAFAYNTVVTLTASPTSPSTFGGWSGGGCSGTGTCSITMNTAQSVMATFNPPGYQTLTVTKTGTGNGTVTSIPAGIDCGADCSESYAYNTNVTLVAATSTGSTFTGWSGACSGTGTCVVSMTSPQSVNANFTINTYTLTVSKTGTGSGTVTSNPAGINCGSDCSEAYAYNTSIILTVIPDTGSTFTGWSGACTGTGACVVSMTSVRSVTATFNLQNYYTMTVNKTGTGNGTVSSSPAGIDCGIDCSEPFISGTMVTLTAVPSTGHIFNGWSGGGCSGTGSCTVAMTEARNITASFNKGPTFEDVPTNHPYYNDIEILYANGLTGGCSTSPLKFCPDQIMNRAQAAVFILRGNFGNTFVPDPATHIFKDDWTKGPWAEPWAEAMRAKGLSSGCSTSPLKYCPWDQIPREQAVIFALRLKYGNSYVPPTATGTLFADMTDKNYYATAWVEQAYKDGLLPNCGISGGKPKICPKALVSRGLGAYMIVKAKNLTMP